MPEVTPQPGSARKAYPMLGIAGVLLGALTFTLATIDCFLLIALSCVVCLVVVACIGSLDIQYKHVLASIKAQRA